MAAQFSDPAWWPKPPPAPPKPISPMKIVFGTVVPVAAVIGVVVFIVVQSRGQGSPAATRSLAAFESCAKSHGLKPGEGLSGPRGSEVLDACRDRLPPGARVGSFGGAAAQSTPQEQFDECVQNATAGLPHRGFGGGRFGGRPSNEFRSAVAVCQSLIESSTEGGATQPTSTSASTPPAA